ncbi:unnamed protein product [Tilletia controversa]|uniref:Superoxide dismutase n=3 Tax=Tilletia TaxID=13289 RepID=A0A8X7SWM1_9BASI|nr:hypothetical protein CF336_g4345 [Tilletia laevis]KAE8196842.1 hypothetical protein CF328_g4021 [Tilletia controversa]KAE8260618.1 hypothetical protein A4X03_0g3745 [Tilletia caries]KAE8201838.1 hypothetical protein CF335_g3654 [Tilletia laevis]KAE8247393.1 hypothetical protein A4X06_0g4493 [Tilletia controversa]
MLNTTLTRASTRVVAASRASLTAGAIRSKHTLPDLSYDYGALEPAISAEIMQTHHQKHHQTYVTNLNAAEESLNQALQKSDVKSTIALQKAINFNGGGHINHTLFWANLAPKNKDGGHLPSGGELSKAIERDFGSLDKLKEKFNAQLAGIQGSGWGWLGYNKATGTLDIATTANQDPLLALTPLIGIDAWEHAYYLQYKNVKVDYFKAIWEVINYKEAEKRLISAQK